MAQINLWLSHFLDSWALWELRHDPTSTDSGETSGRRRGHNG